MDPESILLKVLKKISQGAANSLLKFMEEATKSESLWVFINREHR